MNIEEVSVDSIKPHPKNYRRHPGEQLDHIARSVEQNGLYRPIVVARDGTILAGHGVYAVAVQQGRATVPVVRIDVDADDPRAIKILVGDNEVVRMAEIDDRALTEMLKGLHDIDELLGTGFDAQQLAVLAMVTRPASEIADANAAAQWVGMPEFDAGKEPIFLRFMFASKEDRVRLLDVLGMTPDDVDKRSDKAWAMWWPKMARDNLARTEFRVDASATA
jgi:hypothetical protein